MAEQEAKDPIVINDEDEEEEKRIQHYSSFHQILLVGEGDFSFSLCLANSFGSASNIVASSLQSYEEVIKMYKNGKSNLEKLKALGGTILHGVDATKMELHVDLKNRKFDRVIFNFPHAGFHGPEVDTSLIRKHQSLVVRFFGSARKRLRPDGEIHVTHKITHPFNLWDLPGLALKNSLACIECASFNIENYPGYNNKRGAGKKCDESFLLGECNTFKFVFEPSLRNAQRTRQNEHYLHTPSQKFQEIYSFQQQVSLIYSRNSPTYVHDINGFPSYGGLPPRHGPSIFSPTYVNDMNGFPSYGGLLARDDPSRISPTYINDMSGFPSYGGLPARHVPSINSPTYVNVMNGLPSYGGLPARDGPSRISPTYINDMSGFPSYGGLPARHGPSINSPTHVDMNGFPSYGRLPARFGPSGISPTYINDMSGFPSYAGLPARDGPGRISPTHVNDMTGFPSCGGLLARHGPIINSPTYVDDMNGFPSYGGSLARDGPSRISPTYVNDVNVFRSYGRLPARHDPSRISPTYINDLNVFQSYGGLPSRHGPIINSPTYVDDMNDLPTEFFRLYKDYFSYIQETFGREDIAVEDSVHLALQRGSSMYRAGPVRPSEGYLVYMEMLQFWSLSRLARLQQIEQDPNRRLCEPQGMGYYL